MLDRTKYSHRNFENAVVAQVQVRNVFEVFETARLQVGFLRYTEAVRLTMRYLMLFWER
jgi:hypothetical protein